MSHYDIHVGDVIKYPEMVMAWTVKEHHLAHTFSLFRCDKSRACYRPLYQSMLKELTSFFSSLLFSELCCRVPCNWKYINLFLIGIWATTGWGIYHQAFSATIPSWSGCKFGVFFNIGVRGTHGIQSRHLSAWVISHIQYAKKRFN